ncbi:MAG: SBBP repeat-containing protein, partial [Bacteroidia bacterium]
ECYFNYFISNKAGKYAGNVGLFKEVVIKNVYKGIDIRYYFDRSYLRYDFMVHPGSDPSQIKFKFRGQFSDFTKEGRIVYTTRFGEVQMADLHTYQGNKEVRSRFVKQGELYAFAFGDYDCSDELTIDPLMYSTYLGGLGTEYGYDIAADAAGYAYVTGQTFSTNYDITAGSFQTTLAGGSDVFVTKLNNSGTALIYSTFIGGSSDEYSRGITIDASGNSYVTGYTYSSDYPVTAGVFQTTLSGGNDVFVTKLNATGNGLLYSTFIGGSNSDYGYDIAVDASGNAFITGYTTSTNFDLTAGAFQTAFGGVSDVFVTQLNSTGTGLVYSTLIGGSNNDLGYGVVIDLSGNAYVTGWTSSANYDITASAFQTTNGGGYDAFVTKLNSSGTALVYSTYLG